VKAVEKGRVVTITRHSEPVACVMSYERLSAIAETMEILADPAAMKAIRDHKAGKLKTYQISDIPE
jgi:antitoxin YefM